MAQSYAGYTGVVRMSKSKPVYDDKVAELMALRADLIGAVAQLERVLESKGIIVESAVVTHRKRHNLTRGQAKRNI